MFGRKKNPPTKQVAQQAPQGSRRYASVLDETPQLEIYFRVIDSPLYLSIGPIIKAINVKTKHVGEIIHPLSLQDIIVSSNRSSSIQVVKIEHTLTWSKTFPQKVNFWCKILTGEEEIMS